MNLTDNVAIEATKIIQNIAQQYFDNYGKMNSKKIPIISKKQLMEELNVTAPMLSKYEYMGLKRIEPVESGKIFYSVDDVIDFMNQFKY